MPILPHGGDDDLSSGTPSSASSPGGQARSPSPPVPAVTLPRRLVTGTRDEWRESLAASADAALAQGVAGGAGEIILDMRDTAELDVSGLGLLVVVRQRARDRGVAVRLRGTSPDIRALLAHTRLDALFLFDDYQ